MNYDYSEEKNRLLFEIRGVSFQNIIDSIFDHGILTDFPHPNIKQYPNQRIFVVEFNGYTYCVPYVENGDTIFLKTIFPNRKFMYLLEDR
jgi:hypothetical protein